MDTTGMAAPRWAQQADFDVRIDWGPVGAGAIAADYVVIVDVLRFTTAVEAATTAGASVFPYRWKDDSANDFAARVGAVLADGRDPLGPSLSPVRLGALQPGDRVVLPSPNGSTCAAVATELGATVVAACLRNYAAAAEWLNGRASTVAVIACGERWPDGSLRPSLEDYLGAALLIDALAGRQRSAEAEVAAATVRALEGQIESLVRNCASGRELVARGWADDLDYALEVATSATVPVLRDGAFTAAESSR